MDLNTFKGAYIFGCSFSKMGSTISSSVVSTITDYKDVEVHDYIITLLYSSPQPSSFQCQQEILPDSQGKLPSTYVYTNVTASVTLIIEATPYIVVISGDLTPLRTPNLLKGFSDKHQSTCTFFQNGRLNPIDLLPGGVELKDIL